MTLWEYITIPWEDWINYLATMGCVLLVSAALGLLAYWAFDLDKEV